jgi:tetratricopeptide (TPR) repeat protein
LPWPQTFFHRPVEYDAAAGAYVFPTYAVVLGAVVAVLYAVFALRTFLADRAAGILAVAAVVTLGPLLNFTYTGIFVTTSDHFLYLPLLLFMLAVARRHRERIAEWAERRAVRLGFAGLIAVYAAVDVVRVFDFRDQTSMFEAEVANNPHNPLALKSLAEDRASLGRTDEAFALFLRSSAPESRKYALLMPPWLNYQDYVRLLGLQAARTADGNVSDLMLLYRELLAVLNGGTPVVKGRVGELELGFRPPAADLEKSLLGGGRVSVTAEAALVASRLGDDVRARALLASIGDKYLDVLSNVHNVALAYARLEDFAGARQWEATVMRALPHLYDEHAFDDLEQRLTKAESLFRTAERVTGSAQRRLRARAFVELGGYLRALRELRPAYELYPEDGETGPLYMQLLVASGLVPDARAVAERALGPEAASAMVESTRRALSPRIAKLRKPQGPEDWMTPDPSFQKDEP